MEQETIEVETRPCMLCKRSSRLQVPEQGYRAWRSGRAPIQVALPELSVHERELLMTGSHPECWDEMTRAEEDEDAEAYDGNLSALEEFYHDVRKRADD